MKQSTARFCPGDLAEVRTPQEILQSLDSHGTVDQLPFMPEMVEFCGRRFRVSNRVVKTCYSQGPISGMRVFREDDVVVLENVRCSGAAHDGCQKACLIFWREAWLRKVEGHATVRPESNSDGSEALRARLKTRAGPNAYFCQASELLKATGPLSQWGRITKAVSDVRAGNCSLLEMTRRIAIWLYWRVRRRFLGEYARGTRKPTPQGGLNLQKGDLVQVKSIENIIDTLDEKAHNRGLYFGPGMRTLSGGQYRVERHLDRIIVDGTGEMRQLRDTVYLEDSPCECAYVAFGGCSRCEFAYWREIWLRRSETKTSSKSPS